jgi:hypothetical protein
MKDELLEHLKRMSDALQTGEVSDADIDGLSRAEATLSALDERDLIAIRAIARRNCDLALSARKGIAAARHLILFGGQRAAGQVYDRDGSREGLGGTAKTLSVNI